MAKRTAIESEAWWAAYTPPVQAELNGGCDDAELGRLVRREYNRSRAVAERWQQSQLDREYSQTLAAIPQPEGVQA